MNTTVIERNRGGVEPPSGGGGTRLGRLASWGYENRRKGLLLWLPALGGVPGLRFPFPGRFANKFGGGNSESQRAQNFLKQHFPTQAGDEAQVVFDTTDPV